MIEELGKITAAFVAGVFFALSMTAHAQTGPAYGVQPQYDYNAPARAVSAGIMAQYYGGDPDAAQRILDTAAVQYQQQVNDIQLQNNAALNNYLFPPTVKVDVDIKQPVQPTQVQEYKPLPYNFNPASPSHRR